MMEINKCHYVLKGNIPVEATLDEWATMFDLKNRHVGLFTHKYITISTVFLGLDHNFLTHGDPVLFESMVFGRRKLSSILKLDTIKLKKRKFRESLSMNRYCTYEEAEKGHAELLKGIACKIRRFRKTHKQKCKR